MFSAGMSCKQGVMPSLTVCQLCKQECKEWWRMQENGSRKQWRA